MTSTDRRPRRLQPGRLALVDGRLWAIDRLQPVATALDVASGQLETTVGWAEVPAGPEPHDRRVVGSADGLWVQQPDGPVVLVDAGGIRSAHYVGACELAVVSDHGAWCVPAESDQDLAESEDAPPEEDEEPGELRLLRPGRPTRIVSCDVAVRSLRSADGDLLVEVPDGSWGRRSLSMSDDGPSYELTRGSSWLRLPGDEDVPDQLLAGSAERVGSTSPETSPETSPAISPDTQLSERWDPGTGAVREPAQVVGTVGLEWYVGADPARDRTRPAVAAVAFAPGDDRPRLHLSLGAGLVADAVSDGHRVWVAIEQPELGPTPPVAASVVRIDATTGAVETVLAPDSVDITDRCWPLGSAPVDHDDYVAYWREHLSRLDAFWRDADGDVEPLVEGLAGIEVLAVGAWPDTALDVSFSSDRYPGERLRRRIRLFDDLGRRDEPEDAEIEIMEDLETNRLRPGAPAPDASTS